MSGASTSAASGQLEAVLFVQWFRMYAEFASDPVVQSLSFDDQRHFIVVLCLKCSGVLDKEFGNAQVRQDVIRKALGLDGLAFTEARTRLCAARLVDGEWQPCNWNKRQFISDSDPTAAQRQRRHRERNGRVTRDTTARSRTGHTPQSQIQNQITDTEKTQNQKGAGAPLVLHESLPKMAWEEWIGHRRAKRWPCDGTTLRKQLAVLAEFDTTTQAEIIDKSINAGWQGLFPPKGKSRATFKGALTTEEVEAMVASGKFNAGG